MIASSEHKKNLPVSHVLSLGQLLHRVKTWPVECQLRGWVVVGGGGAVNINYGFVICCRQEDRQLHIFLSGFDFSFLPVLWPVWWCLTLQLSQCHHKTSYPDLWEGLYKLERELLTQLCHLWTLGTPLSGEGSNILGGVRQMKDTLGCKMAAMWASGMITFTPPCSFLCPSALWTGFLRLSPSWLVSS